MLPCRSPSIPKGRCGLSSTSSAHKGCASQIQVHLSERRAQWPRSASIDHLIRETPSGVVVDLKRLFVYPDGHIHLTFKDDTNWPAADAYEAVQMISGDLLRHMQKKATAKARRKAAAEK